MTRRSLIGALSLAIALGSSACTGSGIAVTLRNDSGATLHVTQVGEGGAAENGERPTVAPGARAAIELAGGGTVYFDPVSKLSIEVELDWSDQYPTLHARVWRHVAPAGEVGFDVRRQPKLVADYPFEVSPQSNAKQVEVRAGPIDKGLPITIRQY